MENKVTSYEISKELHEAGFKSESHCGWWLEYNSPIPGKDRYEYKQGADAIDNSYADNEIKAYDCNALAKAIIHILKEKQQ